MPIAQPPPAPTFIENILELWPWFIVFLVLWAMVFFIHRRSDAKDRQTAAELDELIKSGRPPGNE